jgi:signal peptidase II
VRRLLPYLALALAVLALDQATKALVMRYMEPYAQLPLVDGLLSLSHVRNRGAAFGLFSDADLPHQSVLLAVLSLAALVGIAGYFIRLPASARLPRLALALVLGGAIGNLIDRLRFGWVVDFVHVYWRDHQWPDFNVADSAITVGVALLILDIVRSPKTEPAPGSRIDTATPTPGRTS